ncbi:MAG: chemotaxis protein CheW [Deltaproteobacteria bacterium]|nr:chemotaxis protein CheW [Deltaproteobacteria bacterium]
MGGLGANQSSIVSPAECQFVSFLLGQERFGVDIRKVKEITPEVAIMPVPRAPCHVRGLVNVRGQVVLVLDVARMLGRQQTREGAHQIIIIKTAEELKHVAGLDPSVDQPAFGDKPLGILVDELGDVVQVPVGDVETTPPHISQDTSPFFAGVIQHSNGLLVVLNLSHLLAFGGDGGKYGDME